MNSVQLHLALTHVPVILSLAGLIMLVTSLLIKNTTLTRTSYYVLLVAGVAAIPVYFSGEGTEEAIENLPGVSEAIIENHEEIAKFAMISISAAGLAALAALISHRYMQVARIFRIVVLILAIASGGLMAQTAHLGGQIRHTEIRSGGLLQNKNDGAGEKENKTYKEQEKDDD